MGGTTSVLYSGAVEAAAGMMVSGVVSSVASNYETQEELDVTLFRLQQEVIKIRCAINAARVRRIRDPKLFEWLALLINAEIIGKFYQRTLDGRNSRLPMVESEGMSNLPISTFSRPNKRQRTIISLIFGDDELKNLQNVLQKLRSIDIYAFISLVNALPERPVRTYIYMDPNRLLNRDKEIEHIMKFLFEPSRIGEKDVDVLPIIGGIGVGKSSLVVHCFQKPNVQNHFSMKIYLFGPVCSNFPCFCERILWQWNSYNDITHKDENTSVAMIKQMLSAERFLVVMDNVREICPVVWNLLLDCLRCGKQGSKVILLMLRDDYNTRCPNIVKAGILEPLILEWPFSEEEYSLYFKEHVFGSVDPEDIPELMQTGREIEKKMKRSIAGAKILGEILRDNLNVSFWSMLLHVLSEWSFWNGDTQSVCHFLCHLLTICLDVRNVIMPASRKWDKRSYKYKSFGELMALGTTGWTPVIVEDLDRDGKTFSYTALPFAVTKYFLVSEYCVLVAHCATDGPKSTWSLPNSYLLYG